MDKDGAAVPDSVRIVVTEQPMPAPGGHRVGQLLEVERGMADGYRRADPCIRRGRGLPGNRSCASPTGAISRTDI